MSIGSRLKQLLAERQMSQSDLARQLHLSKGTVSGYVNDTHVPDVAVLVKISRLLDVRTDYLLGLTDDPTTPVIRKSTVPDDLPADVAALLASLPEDMRVSFVGAARDLTPDDWRAVLMALIAVKTARDRTPVKEPR